MAHENQYVSSEIISNIALVEREGGEREQVSSGPCNSPKVQLKFTISSRRLAPSLLLRSLHFYPSHNPSLKQSHVAREIFNGTQPPLALKSQKRQELNPLQMLRSEVVPQSAGKTERISS